METIHWDPRLAVGDQLRRWCSLAVSPGVVRVVFAGEAERERLGWRDLEPWTRSRAVTVADVRSALESAALDAALCCDLVYLRTGVELRTGQGEATPGLLWALGRAGRSALARGLLDPRAMTAAEALGIGLAHAVVDVDEGLPLPTGASLTALTTARDIARSAPSARLALELASFRLIFASGDPGEGARAFLERRPPEFGED
ncbi:MAG: hypothetical protein V2I67_17825 [Thermoanaerobaculales bacterium]|nr:hypothetical protein [Thermoanaerobaculales bacterium]